MITGFKEYNGFLWPACDTEASAVVCSQVADLTSAISKVKNFNVAVQAGGNVGVWPKKMAAYFKLVLTFEPEPLNYHCLMENLRETKNVYKYQRALGEKFFLAPMEYPEGMQNMGACCLGQEGNSGAQIITIDSLNLLECDLIQLDIEGMEPRAILGGIETIKRCHPVLMLENKGLAAKYGYDMEWPDKILKPLGYKWVNSINRDVIWTYKGE